MEDLKRWIVFMKLNECYMKHKDIGKIWIIHGPSKSEKIGPSNIEKRIIQSIYYYKPSF